MMNKLVIRKQALEFRSRHKLGSKSPIKLPEVLSKLNVITLFKPLHEKFSGMAFKYDKNLFMMVNSSHSIGKQNFTICHELYHLFIQEDFTSMYCTTEIFEENIEKVELYADLFGSYLLLPEEGLLENIPKEEMGKDKVTLKTVVNLEQTFQCSRVALLHRLMGLGLMSSRSWDNYATQVIKSAKKYGYTNDLYQPGRENKFIGEKYRAIAKQLYDHEIISQSHYLSLLFDIGEDKY